MSATRFLKHYTQAACEEALKKGFDVGVIGSKLPDTDQVTVPHKVWAVKECDKVIGYNIYRIYLQQSDDWDKYLNFIQVNPGKPIDGIALQVILPRAYKCKSYQIILKSGKIMEARVDDFKLPFAWLTSKGRIPRGFVVAWKEIWQR